MKNTILVFVLSLILVNCAHQKTYNDPIPKHDILTIDSKLVNEKRVIAVWTPPSYDTTTSTFPVVYMPDGGLKEDFPHIANTLAKLIASKQIPPIILVGIENTVRGRDLTGKSTTKADEEYCPLTDGAQNFRNFIRQELIPTINKKYRVNNKKGIIGESLAGLFVMETCMQHPDSFDFYIAIDPSIWWNNHYLVRNADKLFNTFPDKKIKLWFAGSKLENHIYSIARYTNQLEEILKKKAPSKLQWEYAYEPKEKHNTIFRATKEKALIWSLANME